MKKIFYLVFTLLAFNSCNENSSASKNQGPVITTIVGTINQAPYPDIIISDDNNRFETQHVNGKFSIDAKIDQPAIYTVTYGRDRSSVFINPGDTLFLKAEGQRFSRTLSFDGKLAKENTYLTQKTFLDRDRFSIKVKDYMLPESEFIAAMDYTRKQNQSELEKTEKEQKFSPAFAELMNNEILYEWATDRVNYKLYHEFYNKVENLQLSENYYAFLKDLNFDDASLLGSVQYKNFISSYTGMMVQKELETNKELTLKDNGESMAKFNFIKTTFKDHAVADFLLYTTLKQHIQYEGANGTQELIDIFNASSQNQNHKTDILKDYSYWENLAEGQNAPGFSYADLNGKIHDLENFKGKYVYIDIWATWCGPCRQELPYLEELQKKYKNNNKIVFTSISIDQDHDAWRKMVTDLKMQGVQLLADHAWQSSIVRDYKITGIPRFLLIGPEGKIISANAPRPSSERIKAKLANLIEG